MKNIIAEFDIKVDTLLKNAQETKDVLDGLTKSQKELSKNGDTSSETFIKNAATIKNLRTEYNAYTKGLQTVLDVTGESTKAQTTLNNELSKSAKSIDGARKSNKELLAIRNKLDLSTKEGIKVQAEINAKVDENNKFIKENVSTLEQQKINIGNYGDALTGALESTGLFGTATKGIITDFKNLVVPLNNAILQTFGLSKAQNASTAATSNGSKALRLFKIALISTGIGAIVVVIGALVAAFLSTQKGIDTVNKALAPLKGALLGIISVFQKLALNIEDIAEGYFGQFKDSFTILINAFTIGAKKMQLAWANVFGDDDDIARIQAEIETQQKEITEAIGRTKDRIDSVKQGFKDAGKEIGEAAKRQQDIVDKTIALEEANIKFIGTQTELNKNIKEQNKLAEDTNNTLAEREAAAVRSVELSKELLIEEQKIIQSELEILDLKNAQTDSSREDLQERANLAAKLNQVETAQLELQTTQQNKVNTIRREAQAKREKHLQKVAKAQQDAIKKQEIQLNLYILQADKENSSLSDKLKLTDQVLKKELEIIDAKQKAGLSSDEADILRIQAKTKALEEQTNATIENANAELELYVTNNEFILNQDTVLNANLLDNKKAFYDERARLQIQALENEGLTDELFAAKRLQIERDRDSAKDAEDKTFKETKKAEDIAQEQLDFENKILRLEEQDVTSFEIEQAKRERDREIAIQKINESILDEESKALRIAKINKDADDKDIKAKKILQNQKLAVANATLGGIAELLGKETAAGKAAAIAQATINTYKGVSQVWGAESILPEPIATISKIANTAVVLASGFKAVKNISSVKAERGISFQGTLKGNSHANGGIDLGNGVEAEGGENIYGDGVNTYVMNKKASSYVNKNGLLGALSSINQGIGGGVPLSTPTSYAMSGGLVQSNLTQSRDTNRTANTVNDTLKTIRVINDPLETIGVADEFITVENEANY